MPLRFFFFFPDFLKRRKLKSSAFLMTYYKINISKKLIQNYFRQGYENVTHGRFFLGGGWVGGGLSGKVTFGIIFLKEIKAAQVAVTPDILSPLPTKLNELRVLQPWT